MSTRTCRWHSGCGNEPKKRGLCGSHYWKLHRAGHFRRDHIDATPVRRWIQAHLDRDRRITTLATLARCGNGHLTSILDGTNKTISPAVASRILAVALRASTVGCFRRVNAMQRLGYSIPDIAERAGITTGMLRLSMDRHRFSDEAAAAIAALYDRLPADQRGPSRIAARRAERLGYPPPAAWEYVDIDDPAATPDTGTGAGRKRTRAQTAAEIAWLHGSGMSDELIAEHLGVTVGTVTNPKYREVAA